MTDKSPLVRAALDLNLRTVARRFGLDVGIDVIDELDRDGTLVEGINARIQTNDIFRRRSFESVYQLSVYRNLLYAVVRALRPRVVVETGVLHGLTSAWILRGLADGGGGRLISIDLPRRDWSQHFGDTEFGPGGEDELLPEGIDPGWIIPDELRDRWELRLGPSQEHLPGVVAEEDVDLFVHDSDHSHETMSFECETVLAARPDALVVIDDYDLNRYGFELLARADAAYAFVDEVDDDLNVIQCTMLYRA